jgi:hypothetical protein
MKLFCKAAGVGLPVLLALAGVLAPRALAQGPIPPSVTPIIVDTAVPIIVNAVKPNKQPAGTLKFEGFVLNANIAQITARAKGNDMAILTFPLSEAAAAKMQAIVDKGGYQYGDKVTIYYDAATMKAIKISGKPSKPV